MKGLDDEVENRACKYGLNSQEGAVWLILVRGA